MKKFIIAALIALTTFTAHAGQVTQVKDGVWKFSGQVTHDDHIRLHQIPDGDVLVMASPGGKAQEAFRMGEIIKEKNLTIKTSFWDGNCVSACAIAAIHANKIEGSLHFHKAYISDFDRKRVRLIQGTIHNVSNKKIDQLIDEGLFKTNNKQADLLRGKGVSEKTIKKFWKTTPKSFIKINFK